MEEQLAEAQALLTESTLSLEAKLERTRVEMENRLKEAEDKAHQAVIDAERSRERANYKNLEFMGLKWKATAHINAVERKLSQLNVRLVALAAQSGSSLALSPSYMHTHLPCHRMRGVLVSFPLLQVMTE